MEIKEYKLEAIGNCGVKSHGGKARIREYIGTGVYSLISYDTEVAAGIKETGEIFRLYAPTFDAVYGGWSATTARHLESFATFCGGTYNGKRSWVSKPYVTIEEVLQHGKGHAAA